MRLLSSDSESENGDQDVSQSQTSYQKINSNVFSTAIPIVDICWSDPNLSLKIHNFDTKDSGCNASLQNLSTPLD